MNNYDLMRTLHFANKLKQMLENGRREQRNEHASKYVRLPLHETQDAIEEIEKHLHAIKENTDMNVTTRNYKDARKNLVAWLLKQGCTITVHDDGEVFGEKNETSITKIMGDLNCVYECSFVAYKDGKSVGWAYTLNCEQGVVDPEESIADFGGELIDKWFNQ